jgi:hypothetical protein
MIRTEVIPFGAWRRDPWVAYTNGSLGERSVLAIPPIGADESSPRVVGKGLRAATAGRPSLTTILRGFTIGRRRDGRPCSTCASADSLRRSARAVGRGTECAPTPRWPVRA